MHCACGTIIPQKTIQRRRDGQCLPCRHKSEAEALTQCVQKQLNLAIHVIGRNAVSGNDPSLCRVFLGESLEEWKKRQRIYDCPTHKDHIVPVSKLNLISDRDLQLAFLGFNYQSISKTENLKKGNLEIPGLTDHYKEKAKEFFIPHLLTRSLQYAIEQRGISPETKKFIPKLSNFEPLSVTFWCKLLAVQFNDDLLDLETSISFLRTILECHFESNKRFALRI